MENFLGRLPHMIRTMIFVLAGCAVVVSASAQQATQSVQAAEQATMTQQVEGGIVTSSMTSSESFAPPSESDPDIGEQIFLQPEQKYQPFSAWTNWNVFWTSNAQLLDDTNGGSDTFMTGVVGGSYLPYLGGNLFAEFSAEQSMFRYARNSSLDFNGLNLSAGLIYVIRELQDLTVFANYNYDLLTVRGFNKEIYHDHAITAGLRKTFVLNRANLVYTSLDADFTLGGWPDYALRHEFAWLAGYQLSLTRMVKLDLYYRLAAQPYRYADRTDLNQLIGGGVTVGVTPWLSVQALSTLGINNSTESQFSYFAANLGGGIGIMVNF